jgi:transitional endoplasmic reticulum ATPase
MAVPIPDRYGRREILEIHSRGMALAKTVDLNYLAEITHGLTGADLETVCREAAMICLRRIMPNMDFSLARIPYDQLAKLEVQMDDLLESLRNVESSALHKGSVGVPNQRRNDVRSRPAVEPRFVRPVGWPPADFAAAGRHRQEKHAN